MMLIVLQRRRSGSNQHFAQDKDVPKQKQCKVNKCIIIIWKGKWIDEALKEAMDAIESGKTSLIQTNR
jgi:hypothetical protein